MNEKVRVPLVHISRRSSLPWYKAWAIRAAAIVLALIVCGVITALLTGENPISIYASMLDGAFGTSRRIWVLLQNIAILLCVSLAVTPAFKMRFWNIGAEGQVLMGCLGSVVVIQYLGGQIDNSLLIIVMFLASVAFSVAWAVIPAIFKAKWRTNETLFTLMMNYVAMQIVAICIFAWVPSGSGVLGTLADGRFPLIGGQRYVLNIIIVAIATVLIFLYFRYSKHGYELSVVGESENTAKYVGINVKKVIIRTMILSGALCGLAGLLLVGGTNYSVAVDSVDNRGFTAILVAWLGKFSPPAMAFTSWLYVFIDQGAKNVATLMGMGEAFPDIITGIFFFLVIGCEFFINYKIKFRPRKKKAENSVEEVVA